MKALPTVAGIDIPVDEHGRFNLNALHHASGAAQHRKPSEWLRLDQASELIQQLTSQSGISRFGAVETIRGGNTPGTFAHKLLAISYAGWISSAFQLQVNQVFLDYRTGKMDPQPEAAKYHIPKTRAEALRLAADLEEQLEQKTAENDVYRTMFNNVPEGSIGVREAGKALKYQDGTPVGQNNLSDIIEDDLRWAFRGGDGKLHPYAQLSNYVVMDSVLDRKGAKRQMLKITPQGQARIEAYLLGMGAKEGQLL